MEKTVKEKEFTPSDRFANFIEIVNCEECSKLMGKWSTEVIPFCPKHKELGFKIMREYLRITKQPDRLKWLEEKIAKYSSPVSSSHSLNP